jgi:hypothetical protein
MTSLKEAKGHLKCARDVEYVRMRDTPSLREQKGYSAIVGLAGVTPPPRSAEKRRTGERVAGSTGGERMLARDALPNTPQRLLETGEPVAVKAARRVWEGAVGKGLM